MTTPQQFVIFENSSSGKVYVTDRLHWFTPHKAYARKFSQEEAEGFIDEYYKEPERRIGIMEEA